MRIHKKRNNNAKRLAYKALVRKILEYEAVCWVSALYWVKREWVNLQVI